MFPGWTKTVREMNKFNCVCSLLELGIGVCLNPRITCCLLILLIQITRGIGKRVLVLKKDVDHVTGNSFQKWKKETVAR